STSPSASGSPSSSPSSSPSQSGGSCTAPPWNAGTAYVGGSQVSFNGHQYSAKWWTQGEQPDTHSGQWEVWLDKGPCSGSGSPSPSTSPSRSPSQSPSSSPTPSSSSQYPAWQPNHAYAVGDRVSYAGHNYQCIQAHTSLVGWEPPNV